MSDSIFRKKSLDRVSSPEELNDYVRVVSPGIWMMLVAIIILLAGVGIWASVGHLDTKVSVKVNCSGGQSVCYIPGEWVDDVDSETVILVNGNSGLIEHVGDSNGDYYEAACNIVLDDGTYEGELVIDSVSPISFLLN